MIGRGDWVFNETEISIIRATKTRQISTAYVYVEQKQWQNRTRVGTADIRKTHAMRYFGNNRELSVRTVNLETKSMMRVSISISDGSRVRGYV